MKEEEIREFLGRMGKRKLPEIKKVQFPQLVPPQGKDRVKVGISYLEDIMVTIAVELGESILKVGDILRLTEGSIVQLDKSAGDLVEVMVNHQRFAKGEVVVIGNNFAIRIHSIYEAEKMKSGEDW